MNPAHPVELVRFLHLLAMAFFVGGQLMLAAVVVPAIVYLGVMLAH